MFCVDNPTPVPHIAVGGVDERKESGENGRDPAVRMNQRSHVDLLLVMNDAKEREGHDGRPLDGTESENVRQEALKPTRHSSCFYNSDG